MKKAAALPRKVTDLFGALVDPPPPPQKKSGYYSKKRSRRIFPKSESLFDDLQLSEEELLQMLEEQDKSFREKYLIMVELAASLGLKIVLEKQSEKPKLFIDHPLFSPREIEARWYSLAIASQAVEKNSIIIIPTGLGKTYIFFLTIPEIIKKDPDKKIVFLCPTKALCLQHRATMAKIMPSVKVEIIFGQTAPKKRLDIWSKNQIIIATPQTIMAEIDKNSGVGRPEDLKLLVFDEVHHASKNHAFAKLAEFYVQSSCRILGLTASPDHKIKTIQDWQKLLQVDNQHLLARNYDSRDVIDYIYYRNIKAVKVNRDLTKLQKKFDEKLIELLSNLFNHISSQLKISIKNLAYRDENKLTGISFRGLQLLINDLKKIIDPKRNVSKEKRLKAYELLSSCALLSSYNYAVKMNLSGLSELAKYLQRKFNDFQRNKSPQGNKSLQRFCKNPEIQKIVTTLYKERLWKHDAWPTMIASKPPERNPDTKSWQQALSDNKLTKLTQIIGGLNSQSLVFVKTRDTLRKIHYDLTNWLPQKKIGILTGTASNLGDPGMTQKQQASVLNDFRAKKIDVLISTSVGEEGLDFPAVDTVIFYEPIEDVRRYIQRLGRTARHREGKVYILMYKDVGKTSDEEKIYYISTGRGKNVKKIINMIEQCQNHQK